MRGGEKCLEVFCELFPQSAIYTLFYEKGKVSDTIARHRIIESALRRFPKIFSHYRYYLPFFPAAAGSFRPEDADLVLSSSHCVAAGIRKPAGAVHISYCHTPMRYAWGFFEEYFGRYGGLSKAAIRHWIRRLREWDLEASKRVDHYVANSKNVQKRIRDFYGREAEVIHPPVDVEFYGPAAAKREDFYLVVSALVPYKKVDLAVAAARKLRRRLVVIGEGPDRKRLEREAGDRARFLGWQPDEVLRDHYRRARGLLFPGEEDFGIVPLEAQACGCPVIAYQKGGALETVVDGETGVFFPSLETDSLVEVIERFERKNFSSDAARRNALAFARPRFADEVRHAIRTQLSRKGKKIHDLAATP